MSEEPVAETSASELNLDQLIIAASRELIAAQRAKPRDTPRIDLARSELERLLALRDG